MGLIDKYLRTEKTNSRCQVARVATFCTVMHNICGALVWKFLPFTLLAPRSLRWLLDFWKICVSLS